MTNKIDQIHQSHDKRLSELDTRISATHNTKPQDDEDVIDFKLEQLKDDLDAKLE